MLNLILAEAALETVPRSLWNHPSVAKRAKVLGKKPGDMLLDRSYHHQAMVRLEDEAKRGRPDIVHFALLEALGTPLNRERLLRVYVHTVDNHVIYVDPKVRLPRHYDRFVGLVEQLYREGTVPVKGHPLLKLKDESLGNLIAKIKPSYVIAFTRKGDVKVLEDAMKSFQGQGNFLAIIGAFPQGHFSYEIMELADISVSIDMEMLEAWTVTSRVIYEFERLIGLPEKRRSIKHPRRWER